MSHVFIIIQLEIVGVGGSALKNANKTRVSFVVLKMQRSIQWRGKQL